MSWRIAYDPDPENPNPHPWELGRPAFATPEEAEHSATAEEDEITREYGEPYARGWFRWLVVQDIHTEVNA